MDLHRIAQEIRPVIYQAGHIALNHFRNVKAERKADRSFVTAADREVEAFLREEIHHRYPDHGIFGEESGQQQMDGAEYVWSIDPIDGTAPFVFEMPIWGVSVGLLHRERPLAGFVYLPVIDELYWAIDGYPAYVNDRQIHVCDAQEIDETSFLIAPSNTFFTFDSTFRGRALSFGSASAHICMVARGKIYGGIISGVRLWDIAGGAIILKAAGGVMNYFSGEEVDLWPLKDGQEIPDSIVMGQQDNTEKIRQLFTPKKD